MTRILFFWLLLSVPSLAHGRETPSEIQYVCSFEARVQMKSVSVSSPTSEVKLEKSRFTLIDLGLERGAYINLEFGVKLPVIVTRNAGYTIFTEDLGGVADNHFVVTIFKRLDQNSRYRAVMSLHWDVGSAFYNPYQSIGECQKTI
jgi:hypothetical protein